MENNTIRVKIRDRGCGIENVNEAIQPFFTTLQGEERSGMGFTIMQTFTDEFVIRSEKGKGTVVELTKRMGAVNLCAEGIDLANREKERLNA